MFKKEWFDKAIKPIPKWKWFLIKLFGQKIVSVDGEYRVVSYIFRSRLYVSSWYG